VMAAAQYVRVTVQEGCLVAVGRRPRLLIVDVQHVADEGER